MPIRAISVSRYEKGLWVAAEGQVYEEYSPDVHLISPYRLPRGWQNWRRIWGVDFGFKNPFVWQEWAISPDNDMYLVCEIYHSNQMVEDLAEKILAAGGRKMQKDADGRPTGRLIVTRDLPDPLPDAIICDHDAEDRATFERHTGLSTIAAYKAVRSGIQAVAARLKIDERTKRPSLFLLRDSLIENDTARAEAKQTICTADEFGSYVWGTSKGARAEDEEPVKLHDHGMDAMRYVVSYVDNIKRGKTVKLEFY